MGDYGRYTALQYVAVLSLVSISPVSFVPVFRRSGHLNFLTGRSITSEAQNRPNVRILPMSIAKFNDALISSQV